MKPGMRWTRRAFVQGMGYASAISTLDTLAPCHAALSTKLTQPLAGAMSPSGFAYIASAGKRTAREAPGIHVFDMRGNHWVLKQTLESKAPAFLALHPSQQFLYVANETDECQGLPCGTVEAYAIDPYDGQLAFINRQPLSLSAIHPRYLAISPDGHHLVVAAYGGGAYNVLPVGQNGEIGSVSGILKEVGFGPHPDHQTSAHPHTVIFDAAGRYLLATDQGCDRFSVFTLQDGMVSRIHRIRLPAGIGPGHMAIHPSGSMLYVANARDGSIAGYRMCTSTGEIRRAVGSVRASTIPYDGAWNRVAIVIPPSGRFLYASCQFGTSGGSGEGIAAWEINSVTGELTRIHTCSLGKCSVHALTLASDGRGLFVADSGQNRVLYTPIDASTGKMGQALLLAEVAKPTSVAIKYLPERK